MPEKKKGCLFLLTQPSTSIVLKSLLFSSVDLTEMYKVETSLVEFVAKDSRLPESKQQEQRAFFT